MASFEADKEPQTVRDVLPDVIQALRAIYAGASATGRWYCEEECKAVGHDLAGPDAGYYESSNAPPGYDPEGWIGTDDDDDEPAEPMKPCIWEDYTLQEQNCWLRTCAHTAKRALETLNVSLVVESD